METIVEYNESLNTKIELIDDFGKIGILRTERSLAGFKQHWDVDPDNTILLNDANDPDNEVIKLYFNMARGLVEVKHG